jgi:putative transposase
MLKRDEKVYTGVVKNCYANEQIPILSEFSYLDDSVIYSDYWKAYNGLVNYGAKAHCRAKHSKNEFSYDFVLLLQADGVILTSII